MVSSNASSKAPKPSHASKLLGPRMTDACKKPPSDRNRKAAGRDRRIVLPKGCADRVFELRKRLDHRTPGQTVEWLLIQAKPWVDAVLNPKPPSPKNGNGMSASVSMANPVFPSASDVELSADEVARFLFADHGECTLDFEEKQQKEK